MTIVVEEFGTIPKSLENDEKIGIPKKNGNHPKDGITQNFHSYHVI